MDVAGKHEPVFAAFASGACPRLLSFPSWLRHEVLPVQVPSGGVEGWTVHDQLLGPPGERLRS
jgi:hypothetical protein